jgi:Domain of unknown function (DUF2019)
MSAEDLAQLSTEELIRRFVATAKATATLHSKNLTPEAIKVTPERMERVARMQALGAALRDRKPVAEIRPLFEDDHRDVRSWAAGQFLSTDPEWARAAWSGLCSGLATREVLDLTRRARRRPPQRPTLQAMSDDALIERFEDAATRKYAIRFLDIIGIKGDMALSNRISDELRAIVGEVKARDALARLAPLMDHRLITVRHRAARACLGIEPERAAAIIASVKASKDWYEMLNYSDILDRARATGEPDRR